MHSNSILCPAVKEIQTRKERTEKTRERNVTESQDLTKP